MGAPQLLQFMAEESSLVAQCKRLVATPSSIPAWFAQALRLSTAVRRSLATTLDMLVAMGERIDSRDVMDTNARTMRAFAATVLGHFRRTGANPWDDYEWVEDAPESVAVAPGIPVQLERHGAEVRLRRHGEVFRVRWEPDPEAAAALRDADPEAIRAYFLENFVSVQANAPGIGAAAVISSKLSH
jgi:hypothetical protein